MKHQSFDMHFFRNREGYWCASYTLPDGQRMPFMELSEWQVEIIRTWLDEVLFEHNLDIEYAPNEQDAEPCE